MLYLCFLDDHCDGFRKVTTKVAVNFCATLDLASDLTDCDIRRAAAMSDGEEYTSFSVLPFYFPLHLQSKMQSIVIMNHYHPSRHTRGSITEIQV